MKGERLENGGRERGREGGREGEREGERERGREGKVFLLQKLQLILC